ncbi:unnamed protein product [Meganyctiphanes norvegica]|uniref:MARVEL domain-containing protein n=1 Tax=Meganyctiphanes norvegica TaxID=48144 RepID=A0AAV2RG41_MEGNR
MKMPSSRYHRSIKFIVSPPAILKGLQMVLLLVSVILFLVDNDCSNDLLYMTVFIMPCVVCIISTAVTCVTALAVATKDLDPTTTKSWAKGDALYSLMALVVMGIGTVFTITHQPSCDNNPTQMAAIVLGFFCVLLYGASSILTYNRYSKHQGRLQDIRRRLQVDHT